MISQSEQILLCFNLHKSLSYIFIKSNAFKSFILYSKSVIIIYIPKLIIPTSIHKIQIHLDCFFFENIKIIKGSLYLSSNKLQ